MSCIKLINNLIMHSRIKHIKLRHHYIRERIINEIIEVEFSLSEYQQIDNMKQIHP